MKFFSVFVILLLIATSTLCQNSLLVKRIDSLVIQINRAKLKIINDSTSSSEPGVSLEMYSYSTAFFGDSEFAKFFSKDSIMTNINGTIGTTKTAHVLYFYKRTLIKAESYVSFGNFNQQMIWYYWDRRIIKKQPAFPIQDKLDDSNLELADALLNKYQREL